MFRSQTLIGFTKLFSPKRFQDNDKIVLNYFLTEFNLRMVNKTTNMYRELEICMYFRLIKINEIKYYFTAKIHKKDIMSKTLCKYVAVLD